MKKETREKIESLMSDVADELITKETQNSVINVIKNFFRDKEIPYNRTTMEALNIGAMVMFKSKEFSDDPNFQTVLLILLEHLTQKERNKLKSQVDKMMNSNEAPK